MKNSTFFYITVLFVLIFTGCTSVEKYNAHSDKKIAVNQLRKDVDFVYKKLLNNHAKLDFYLSKNLIDKKFDSLKKTIQNPLKPNDFYLKLYPVLRDLRHGHTDVFPYTKKQSKEEIKRLKDSKGVLGQMTFFWENDSVYLVRSTLKDSLLKTGSVLLKIDDVSPYDLRKKYKNVYYGDGYNATYADNRLNRSFIDYYFTLEIGVKDSVKFDFKYNGKEYSKMVYRIFPEKKTEEKSDKKDKPTVSNGKNKPEKFTIKPFEYDYKYSAKTFSKILSFPTNDSAFAVLKINNFNFGKYEKTYKDVFTKIKAYKVKNLVIDLRNNGGGKLADSNLLFNYLVKDNDKFLGEQIITNSKAIQQSIVDIMPWYAKPIIYPVSLLSFALTRTNDKGENYIKPSLSRVKFKSKDLIFDGNVYVLINGGSYSASVLISSNLKSSNRAYFVGEETGGDATGTVAGFMPVYKLPNSKLKLSIGTIFLQPAQAELFKKGNGIYPDFEIKPTLKDKQKNIDPELIWVLTDIKNGNKELKKVVNSSQKN